MTICKNDGGHCVCQPDEGVPCPNKPKGWWRRLLAFLRSVQNRSQKG